MKKILTKITILALVLITALTFTGCSLFIAEPSKGNGSGGNLPNSSVLSSTVTFEPLEDSERVNDMTLTAQKVARSSVSIMMENSGVTRGSGVLVDITTKDDKGNVQETENEFYILTNHHVIDTEGDITVYLADRNGRHTGDVGFDESFVFTGVIDSKIHNDKAVTLVGGDRESDVAVLKLDLSKSSSGVKPSDIVTVSAPKDGYLPKLGEPVLSLGNPGGYLPGTVAVGVISYIDRQVSLDIGNLVLLQHNASIDHGSSGGGLFNAYGELIGLTNAGSDSLNNIFYAVPHKHQTLETDNGFVTIAKQLIASKTATNYGYVSGRWMLGVTVQENTDHLNQSYVSIQSVVKGSNADKAGMLFGDIITSVTYTDEGGQSVPVPITTLASFSGAIDEIKKTYQLGDSFTVGIRRLEGNRYVNRELTLKLSKQYIFCDTFE